MEEMENCEPSFLLPRKQQFMELKVTLQWFLKTEMGVWEAVGGKALM